MMHYNVNIYIFDQPVQAADLVRRFVSPPASHEPSFII